MDGRFFWEMVAHEVGKQKTSFEWLYQKAKVSKGTFSSWKARNMLPRADAAYKIAQSLGVSVEYLLTGREPPKEYKKNETSLLLEEIAKEIAFFDSYDLKTLRMLISSMSQRYRH